MRLEPTKKDRGTKENSDLRAGLYLCATPIGNLRDITLRALDVLEACHAIACEDTRQTRKLLQAYGIEKPLLVYNDHASDKQRAAIVGRIQGGEAVALVSDAGMPLVSDPGYKLVQACYAAGLSVTSLPGANAPLSALQLSGLPSHSFSFLGFLPAKTKARREMLAGWKEAESTLVIFESAPRLTDSLADMLAVLGDRPAAVVRELTKLYEEARCGALEELVSYYKAQGEPKGEIVVVVGPPEVVRRGEAELIAVMEKVLSYLGTKQASALVADLYGQNKKEMYDLALRLSEK